MQFFHEVPTAEQHDCLGEQFEVISLLLSPTENRISVETDVWTFTVWKDNEFFGLLKQLIERGSDLKVGITVEVRAKRPFIKPFPNGIARVWEVQDGAILRADAESGWHILKRKQEDLTLLESFFADPSEQKSPEASVLDFIRDPKKPPSDKRSKR